MSLCVILWTCVYYVLVYVDVSLCLSAYVWSFLCLYARGGVIWRWVSKCVQPREGPHIIPSPPHSPRPCQRFWHQCAETSRRPFWVFVSLLRHSLLVVFGKAGQNLTDEKSSPAIHFIFLFLLLLLHCRFRFRRKKKTLKGEKENLNAFLPTF